MKFSREDPADGYVIRSYSDKEFVVGDTHYSCSLIVMPDRVIPEWHPRSPEQLQAGDFEMLSTLGVDLVLLGTGKSQAIEVSASGGLAEEDVDRLVEEAEGAKEDDHVRREFVELSNKADGLVYSTARTLEEFADQVSDEERTPIQAALEDARAAMESDDIEALRGAVDELSSLTYKMTENLYAALGEDESEDSD